MAQKTRRDAKAGRPSAADFSKWLGRFYKTNLCQLLAMAGKRVPADAAPDVVQTLMEHFLAKQPHADQIQDKGYLDRSLRNRGVDWVREEERQRRRESKLLNVTPEGMPLQEPSAEDCAATAQDFAAVLDQLHSEPRALLAFHLIKVDGLTAKQAGDRMGLSRYQVYRLTQSPAFQAMVAAKHPPKARRRRKSSTLLAAIVALLMALVPIQASRKQQHTATTVVTRANEHEVMTLDDGSTVELGPETTLTVTFRPTQRLVYLTSGQAMFDVAHDSQRPFLVRTETLQAKAMGTRFTVGCSKSQCTTTVAEGVVEVTALGGSEQGVAVMVHAGQQLSVPVEPIEEELASLPASVQDGRDLMFMNKTAGDIVADFNRRHAAQFHVDEPKLATRRIAVVSSHADSVASFVEVLEGIEGIALIRGSHHE